MYPSDTENPLNLERNGSENSVNLAVCSFKEIEKKSGYDFSGDFN